MTSKQQLKELKKCQKAAARLANTCYKYNIQLMPGTTTPYVCNEKCPLFQLCAARKDGFKQPPMFTAFDAISDYLKGELNLIRMGEDEEPEEAD